MSQKDLAEKNLEAYDDVFADIVNVLLFHGNRVVYPSDLEEGPTGSIYKAGDFWHGQERDVAKYWKMSNVRIALCGMENQTRQDEDITLRLFGYDGAAYRAQLLKDDAGRQDKGGLKETERLREKPLEHNGKKNNLPNTVQAAAGADRGRKHAIRRYPVVTLVLYFGTKNHWRRNLSLKERLIMPEELKPFVNDYHVNLYEIAWLTDEQVGQFQSDFRIVADYFVQMRKNRQYVPGADTMEHVEAVLGLLSALTQDDRFEEVAGLVKKGERRNMCEVLDLVEERGYNRGVKEGIEKGMEKGIEKGIEKGMEKGRLLFLIHQVCKKLQKSETTDEIAQELEEGKDIIRKICEAAEAFAPEYNCEEILKSITTGFLF